MRRNSPPRFPRRSPPPKRGGRPRSLSPLSRSQPAPPGEDRSRKMNHWDAQNFNKRPRSRSRSRDRFMRIREGEKGMMTERIIRDHPDLNTFDNRSPRDRFDGNRQPPRDIIRKDEERMRERSRERHRERLGERPGDRHREHERDFHPGELVRSKEPKSTPHFKRQSHDHGREPKDGFEENYLQYQKNNFEHTGGYQNNHEDTILDPAVASISFNNAYLPKNTPDIQKDISRDNRHPKRPSPNSSFGKHEGKHDKEEKAEDRIIRLEKLVEQLVGEKGKTSDPKVSTYPKKSKEGIPELIPSNNKFTTSMWINKIHEESLRRNYEERSSIRFMQDQMTGIMKAWFKTVSNYDFTWPEIKLLIIKTFPDNIDFAQTLKLLVARDKMTDETITQYYFSKVYLCECCKITGENAVSCLIDGLSNPFMKQDIKSYKFLTPEALYSEYLTKYPEHDVPVRNEHREVHMEQRIEPEFHVEEFMPPEGNVRDREYPHSLSIIRGDRLGRPPFATYQMMDQPMERQICLTCKKFGHSTVDCRHAPICYKCNKKGHIAKKCHFHSVQLISCVGISKKQAQAPMVTCTINGKEVCGAIDTGSMVVTMKKYIAKDLNIIYTKTDEILEGYGGSMVTALGEADVNININSVQCLVKVFVVEDTVQNVPIIVGQEFLAKKGIGLFMQDGKAEIFYSNAEEKGN